MSIKGLDEQGKHTNHTWTFFLCIAGRHDKFFPQFRESFEELSCRQNLASGFSSTLLFKLVILAP